MNIGELKNKLDDLNVRPSDYSLEGTIKAARTILLYANSKWLTFECDENGKTVDKKVFETENEACQDMLNRMIYLKEWRKKRNLK